MCCLSVQVAPSLSYLLLPHTLKELFKAKKLSAAVTLNCTNAHPKAHTMAMLSESLVWHTKITMLHCLDIVKSHYAVHFRTYSMRRRQIKAGFTLLKPIFPTPHRAKKVCHLNRSQRPLTWLLIAHRLTPFGTVRKNGYYAFELSVLPLSLKKHLPAATIWLLHHEEMPEEMWDERARFIVTRKAPQLKAHRSSDFLHRIMGSGCADWSC